MSKKAFYFGVIFLFFCLIGFQIQKKSSPEQKKVQLVGEQDVKIMKKYLGYVQRDIYHLFNIPLFNNQDEWRSNEYSELFVKKASKPHYMRKLGDRDIWLMYSEISTDAYYDSLPENILIFQYLEGFPLSRNIGKTWEEIAEKYPGAIKSTSADSPVCDLQFKKEGLAFSIVFDKGKKAVEYIKVAPINENAGFQAYKVIKQGKQDYSYKIYDETGKMMESGKKSGMEPIITYISENILELRLNAGMCAGVRYFDIKNRKASETYSDPVYADEDLIAYMSYLDDKRIHLIVRNMFDREKLDLDVDLDFYPAARPYDSLRKLERIDDTRFRIFYISPDENGKAMEREEIIKADFDSDTWEIVHEREGRTKAGQD